MVGGPPADLPVRDGAVVVPNDPRARRPWLATGTHDRSRDPTGADRAASPRRAVVRHASGPPVPRPPRERTTPRWHQSRSSNGLARFSPRTPAMPTWAD